MQNSNKKQSFISYFKSARGAYMAKYGNRFHLNACTWQKDNLSSLCGSFLHHSNFAGYKKNCFFFFQELRA